MTRKRKPDRQSNATSYPIERQRKSSNETKPSSKPRSVRETASASDPEKLSPVVEHENSGSEPSQEQGSNGETQLVADSERSAPDHVGSEGGLGAEQNPEFVHSAITFVHQEAIPAEYADAKPETRSAFESKAQALMETMRSANMSINEIANLWKMSKAGVWNRVGHIQPRPPPQPPVAKTQLTNREGGDDSYRPQVPRINSEIIGDRPEVIEDNNNGYDSTASMRDNNGKGTRLASSQPADPNDGFQSASPTGMENGNVAGNGGTANRNRIPSDQALRPITIAVDPRDPRLQDIFLQLAHMAAARGVSFQEYFMSEKCIEDLRDTVFAKTLVTGDGPQFRNNLMTEIRKANAYDKTRRSVGLESPPLGDVGEQP